MSGMSLVADTPASHGHTPAILVLVSGVQGSGKTTLGTAVARDLGALQTMVVDEPLARGARVLIECVMAPGLRAELKEAAASKRARVFVVECVCSDKVLHRRRVDARYAAGLSSITWDRVQETLRTYEPDSAPDYVADAVVPVGHHVRAIATAIERC